jgi:hypothetical protein
MAKLSVGSPLPSLPALETDESSASSKRFTSLNVRPSGAE